MKITATNIIQSTSLDKNRGARFHSPLVNISCLAFSTPASSTQGAALGKVQSLLTKAASRHEKSG
jgi:hypothetical protein